MFGPLRLGLAAPSRLSFLAPAAAPTLPTGAAGATPSSTPLLFMLVLLPPPPLPSPALLLLCRCGGSPQPQILSASAGPAIVEQLVAAQMAVFDSIAVGSGTPGPVAEAGPAYTTLDALPAGGGWTFSEDLAPEDREQLLSLVSGLNSMLTLQPASTWVLNTAAGQVLVGRRSGAEARV